MYVCIRFWEQQARGGGHLFACKGDGLRAMDDADADVCCDATPPLGARHNELGLQQRHPRLAEERRVKRGEQPGIL